MTNKLKLDPLLVDNCHSLAQRIVSKTLQNIEGLTTVSIERSVVRLFGVDGVNDLDIPIPNVFIDALQRYNVLQRGAAYWLAAGMIKLNAPAQSVVEYFANRKIDVKELESVDSTHVRNLMERTAIKSLEAIKLKHSQRVLKRDNPERYAPLIYVLTATGNVYEDVAHAKTVAIHGGDIVAVIRSTAQSLLDYVPYGATTEGFGGTYATQENFRIMRKALDEWSENNGRYIRLSSFCSGLCMPEIAVMGALEGLDNMVNDALYGILYRDINMVRTLIDQRFSRCVNGYFGITINTGEDNYLRTADALKAAPSVVASQLINLQLAKTSGVPEKHVAIGNAFEIHPDVKNGLLYEIAHAQLTRELFPNCPVKYMPPTKHMDGNLLRTHANDTLFNFVSILTRQAIQTLGVPTEGIFTPHIHDRALGLECANYVHNFSADLGDEIFFKEGGFIQARANEVLNTASNILEFILEDGLFSAISQKVFGNVSRNSDDGKGAEGIIQKSNNYCNPFLDVMRNSP